RRGAQGAQGASSGSCNEGAAAADLGQARKTAHLIVTELEPAPSAPPPPPHHETPIRRFLFESALIVFSILLALAVNQWVDKRKQRETTDRAVTAIRAEIAGNADRVRERLPYHRQLEADLRRVDSLGIVHRYSDFKRAAPEWSGFENPEF